MDEESLGTPRWVDVPVVDDAEPEDAEVEHLLPSDPEEGE